MLLTAITDVAEVKKEKVKEPVAVRCKQPSTADATKGIYPCGFRNCNVKLPIARILNHVRSCHPKELIEV